MATLDKIMQMQQQGIAEGDIINQLKNEGISPSEINDSINQAKIKNAVSPPEPITSPSPGTTPQEITPSIANPNISIPGGTPAPEVYPPQEAISQTQAPIPTEQNQFSAPAPGVQPQDTYAGQNYTPQDQYATDPYATAPQDDYYQQTPQAYSDQEYYGGGGAASSETISEIAEQVTLEKLNEYKKKVGDVASFKNTIQDKVNDIDDRLKRIEGTIDKLQQAIIGKIGEFGESNAMIHKDLENLHGTVGKLMNPLVDTYNELKKK